MIGSFERFESDIGTILQKHLSVICTNCGKRNTPFLDPKNRVSWFEGEITWYDLLYHSLNFGTFGIPTTRALYLLMPTDSKMFVCSLDNLSKPKPILKFFFLLKINRNFEAKFEDE